MIIKITGNKPAASFSFTIKNTLRLLCLLVGLSGGVSALAEVAPLSVNGNKILSGGQQASFAGNSLFWSNNGWGGEKFYNAGVVQWLKNDWNSMLVRAAMGVEDVGGYLDDPSGNKQKVKAVVDAAIANDMYVIIDWHSHHAEQNTSAAIAFFEEMATAYGDTNNVIYEIYNEPLAVSWSGTIKPYAESVISAIRAIDPDNLIVVGTPTWSQDVDVASADPITGYDNIAYTLHFYSGTHQQSLRNKATTALNNGVALFATEWGTVNANGDGAVNRAETDAWMEFFKTHGISHANWSINDKAEGASALNPGASTTGGWSSADLTESGSYVRNIVLNWGGSTSSPDPDPTPSPEPASGTALPGLIEAENYSSAPVETTPGNSGSPTACTYLGMDVDVENSTEGGCNVGWTEPGEKLTYNITTADHTYDINLRLASMDAGKRVSVYVNSTLVDTVSTNGGGWQSWTTATIPGVYIPANAVLTVEFYDGATNLNYLDIVASSTSPTEPTEPTPTEPTPTEPPTDTSGFPCSSSNSDAVTNGGTSNVAQGQCLKYNHGNGSIRLGTWSGSGTITYDIKDCNGNIMTGVEQVLNGFSVVDTGTNFCDHYIYVKQAPSSYNLQFGSW